MFARSIPHLFSKGQESGLGALFKSHAFTVYLSFWHFHLSVCFAFDVGITKCNSAVLRTCLLIYGRLAFINTRTNKLGVRETCKSCGNLSPFGLWKHLHTTFLRDWLMRPNVGNTMLWKILKMWSFRFVNIWKPCKRSKNVKIHYYSMQFLRKYII